MPPFRKGQITVDGRFDGEALKALRDVGHGRRINIVDRSYDVPDGARRVKFPGSSADALLGIVRLIPIEKNKVTYMEPDPGLNEGTEPIAFAASKAFEKVLKVLSSPGSRLGDIEVDTRYREDKDELEEAGRPGFYSQASDENEQHLFVVTQDELPFACASVVVGHSQRT